MSNGVWCERILIAWQWHFSSTDSCKTLFSPAHNILNDFFSIFWMKVSWTSFLSLFTLMWGKTICTPHVHVTHPPLVCDPTILTDALYCVCEGGWGIYCGGLSSLYWSSSVWVKPLDGKDMNLSNWRSFGRQRLMSLRLHFQVSNDYFNYLFLLVVVFDVFDLISLDLM